MSVVTKCLTTVGKSVMKIKPVAKLVMKASAHKPELLAIGGGVLVTGAFIGAVNGGTKLHEAMEEGAAKVEAIEAKRAQKLAENGISEEEQALIIAECEKELRKARMEGTWKVIKLFILPSGLLVAGLAMIGGGHDILRKRNIILNKQNIALAGLAESAKETLKSYRENVIANEGEEADKKYLHGIVGEQEIEAIEKDENGKSVKVKKKLPVTRMNNKNPFRFVYNELYFRGFVDNGDANLSFLQNAELYWDQYERPNHKETGVSVYEILDYLHYNFKVDKDGMTPKQYNDWITLLRNTGWKGDDRIDFGLLNAINNPARRRQSDIVIIEFNANGNLQVLI